MKNFQYIVYFFVLLLSGAVYFSLKFSYIGSDAPYYLSVARDISSGLVPYKDIYLSYTPLAMYFNALLFKIFSGFEYSLFLFFQYLLIFAGGLLLYLINWRQIDIQKQKAGLLSVFFVLAVMSSDGNDIALEIYSVLFVLFSLFFFFKNNIFWVGFFLGLSFFCKQFGLLNFVPFFLWFLLEKKHFLLQLPKIAAGALVPLLLFLLYFVGFQNIPLASLFNQLNGAAYVSYTLVSWGSITDYLIGAKVFILLVIPLVFYKDIQKDRLNFFLIVGVVVNLLPLMLQSFQHYYINTFPFLFVLIGRAWANSKNKIILYHAASVFLITGMFYLRVFRYSDRHKAQQTVSHTAQNMLSRKNEVFLNGSIRYLYLMNNYSNPVVSKIGYSYPYKPDRTAMDTINVLSNSELHEAYHERMRIGNKYLYLYLKPSNDAID